MSDGERPWVADPSIGWRILLTAELVEPPSHDDLQRAWRELAAEQGWSAPPGLRRAADPASLRRDLTGHDPAPLVIGAAGDAVVLSAHHSALDGLALLTALSRLGAGPVTSGARGVAGREPAGSAAATIARRLAEAAFRPPARLTTPAPVEARSGDTLVEASYDGTFPTADLVHAAARAVVAHEAARGRVARRVAVAIGAGRGTAAVEGGLPDDRRLRDRSALLRLRDVDLLDRGEVADALRAAPLQPPPVPGRARPWTPLVARAAATGLRVLGPRLGSTLLISHLGAVTAPGVRRLSFHPVTAGGTGLSLGAVAADGRTTLTLRGRAGSWDDDGLEQLLEAVISLL